MNRILFTAIAGLLLISSSVLAQRQITLEDLNKNNTFNQKTITGIKTDQSGDTYTKLDDNKVVRYSYATGKVVKVVFDLTEELREPPFEIITDYKLNPDNTFILLETNRRKIYRRSTISDYYLYDFRKKEISKLHNDGNIQEPEFSPDGYSIGYVHKDNIYIKNLRYNTDLQVTKDGDSTHIVNGLADWVYEEEFTITKLWDWSPDGKFLAYLKFDKELVGDYYFPKYAASNPFEKENEKYPSLQIVNYPKAGTSNSTVEVCVYDIRNNISRVMAVEDIEDGYYIPRIKWTASSDRLCIFQLNRMQDQLNLLLANPRSTVCKLLHQEINDHYLLEENFDEFEFLPDGEHFVMLSEKDGYNHLYLYRMDGMLKKQLTKGEYDVLEYKGYNPENRLYYYLAAAKSPLQREVYAIDEKGKKLICYTAEKGFNNASFSHNYNYYLASNTTLNKPISYSIYNSKGQNLRTIEANSELTKTLETFDIPHKTFFTVKADDGTELNGWMVKPLNFDPNKKYPVVMKQYGGPNYQIVLDKFTIGFEHYLATQNYISVCVDGRGTGGRGEDFRKCTYMKLGLLESDDQITTAKYLASLPYVAKDKIAIWGWSFGGYNTLMSMSRSNGVFAAGIAVAPVTDWKFYDTAYTERFMRTPQQNPNGYAQTSPLKLAGQLSGNLLLCHGTADDNVHFQNTVEYADALIQAGKQFDMQIYPNKAHSISGSTSRMHLYSTIMRFLDRNLK